ncbi:toxin-antitoxin system HicB family antitoxin [Streptomyces sp. NPDC059371]|uniref:toxin-antitoxin system HicB family antitoxin n=1 Tax=Streptomyces sp. NPDC059371 TaxID=3346812 RepID=UPI0036D17709
MFIFALRISEELHARLTAQAAADRQPSTSKSCTCSIAPDAVRTTNRPDGDFPAPALLHRDSHSPPA